MFQALDDTRFNLLVFGPAPPAAALATYGDLIRTHAIPLDPDNRAELDRAGIAIPSFYLLRPDGHIGLCGAASELPGVEFLSLGAMAAPAGQNGYGCDPVWIVIQRNSVNSSIAALPPKRP